MFTRNDELIVGGATQELLVGQSVNLSSERGKESKHRMVYSIQCTVLYCSKLFSLHTFFAFIVSRIFRFSDDKP